MQYQEAVQEARRLVKRSEEDQWRLAQLTWEQLQTGISQQQWADDVGLSRRYVRDLAAVWAEFGAPTANLTNRPPFADAYVQVKGPREDRYVRAGVRNMPVEQKAEVARELLAEPKVADSVMRDTHTRRVVGDARERVASEIEDAARDREQASPVQRELARAGTYFEIANHQRLARFHAAEATRMLQELDDRDPGWMKTFERNDQEIHDALDWFGVAMRGGKVDDEALAKFLEGGAA